MDTIAAKVTAPGLGAVGIVRISGAQAAELAQKMTGRILNLRQAYYLPFLNGAGEIIDYGIAILFKAPHSFTGEDVFELQGHGGPKIMEKLLTCALELGARLAEPGEFSKRAFLNNKMDLLQAEAIHALIQAKSDAELRAALRSLQGAFSTKVSELIEAVIYLRMLIEAGIDFPEEELEGIEKKHIEEQFEKLLGLIDDFQSQVKQGQILSEGVKCVIAGKPNAGKSSLLNALSQREVAIVTDIPGTTRDIVQNQVQVEGVSFHLCDTAGLRDSQDVIEQEGIKRAVLELHTSDHIIWMIDVEEWEKRKRALEQNAALSKLIPELAPYLGKNIKVTVCVNKIDQWIDRLHEEKVDLKLEPAIEKYSEYSCVYLSVKTTAGLNLLKKHLSETVAEYAFEGDFSARTRHVLALERGASFVKKAQTQFVNNFSSEIVAEELKLAQDCFSEITGKFTSDDLLGKIFSEFCIGK